MTDNMKAVVLAAGEGSRLGQLTDTTPKPFLPMAEGKRIIDYVIDNLKTAPQIGELHIALSPKDYEHVRHRTTINGYDGDVRMHPALGWETGGDLKSTAYEADIDDTFVQCFGDNITRMDMGEMIDFHEEMGKKATVALFEVSDEERSRMGIGQVEGGEVTEWAEKPDPDEGPDSNLANAGYYVFEPEALDLIPYGEHKTERTAIPQLVDEGELSGFEFDTPYWFDVGTPESYDEANRRILDHKGVITPPQQNNDNRDA